MLSCARLLIALFCALASTLIAQSLEYQVRAAFLLNFTRFVEWPLDELPSPPDPVDICILGDDPFGTALDQLVAGETLGGSKLQVQRINGPVPPSCRVLYVSRNETSVGSVLEGVGPGVLTVGEGDDFLREGGMVAFLIEKNRVRFDINRGAALKAHLMLSSKLLHVARTVWR
jgi:hypothetical protein